MFYQNWITLKLLLTLHVSKCVISQDTPLVYTIEEESNNGTLIGNLFYDYDFQSRYSQEEFNRLQFSFQNEAYNGLFSIKNGILRTASVIDRDALCPYMETCVRDIEIQVLPFEYLEIVSLQVDILDKNDRVPIFSEVEYELSLSESAAVGSSLSLPTAVDEDSPQFGVQSYSLDPTYDKFELKVTTTSDNRKTVSLVLTDTLDREDVPSYAFMLTAKDGSSPPKTATLAVTLEVLDVNDNNPIFEESEYSVDVNENTFTKTPVFTASATDYDTGISGKITYSFDSTTVKDDADLFSIDNSTGVIKLIGELDREVKEEHVLILSAQDQGLNSIATTARLTIHVLDVNDNAPRIRVKSPESGSRIELPENIPTGGFVAHINIVDVDAGINSQFDCDIMSDVFKLERVYQTEFKIVTKSTFDREIVNLYRIQLTCQDKGSPAQASSMDFEIHILDANDNAPEFRMKNYQTSILENNPLVTYVTSVAAEDTDFGENGRFTYSIEQSVRSVFRINPTSGNITTKMSLDYETIKTLEFEVYAVDMGQPPMTGTATVTVEVIDTDDERPNFKSEAYTLAVYEKEPIHTQVGKVEAEDLDSPPFNSFTYKFGNMDSTAQNLFTIDSLSGVISTNTVLDREEQHFYEFEVLAVGNNFKPYTSTATVSVYVADVNDHAPTVTFPTAKNNSIQISNRLPTGHVITRVIATDKDAGNNAQLQFAITSGNKDGYFKIDNRTGVLKIHKMFEGIDNQAFGLIFSVKDHGEPPLATEAFLNVIVNKSLASPVLGGSNVTTVIIIACVSGCIVVILVIAILAIVRQKQRTKGAAKYNYAAKIYDRNSLVNTTQVLGGDVEAPDGKLPEFDNMKNKKKEVSFDDNSMEINSKDVHLGFVNQVEDDLDNTSNADSGRGSNDDVNTTLQNSPDGKHPPRGSDHVHNDNKHTTYAHGSQNPNHRSKDYDPNINSNSTKDLPPGSYGNKDIAHMFKRDILYRDNQQLTEQNTRHNRYADYKPSYSDRHYPQNSFSKSNYSNRPPAYNHGGGYSSKQTVSIEVPTSEVHV